MLQIIDQRWREHLAEMDYLREGINLRAMGQQDPLVAWQREGFQMFGQMMDAIDDDYLRYVMHVQVVSQPAEEPDLTQASYQAAEDPLEGPSLSTPSGRPLPRGPLGGRDAVPVGVGPGTSGDGAGHEASRAVGAAGPSRPAGPVTANVGRDGRTPRTARPADPDAQAPLVKSPSEKLGRNETVLVRERQEVQAVPWRGPEQAGPASQRDLRAELAACAPA